MKSVSNFRDLGGVKNAKGRVLKRGMLMRSGNLRHLTAEDGELLRDVYNVKLVIDLRTDYEVEEKPDVKIPGVSYVHIPLFQEVQIGITREKGCDLKTIAENCEDNDELLAIIPDLSRVYPVMAEDPFAISQISKVLKLIMNHTCHGKGVLYHCTAGKDRTGIISMLLLYMLGFSGKEITRDYLKTNRSTALEANKYYLLMLLARRDRRVAAKVRNVYVVKREYLEAFYNKVHERQTMKGYILKDLGIEKERVLRFRKEMLYKYH